MHGAAERSLKPRRSAGRCSAGAHTSSAVGGWPPSPQQRTGREQRRATLAPAAPAWPVCSAGCMAEAVPCCHWAIPGPHPCNPGVCWGSRPLERPPACAGPFEPPPPSRALAAAAARPHPWCCGPRPRQRCAAASGATRCATPTAPRPQHPGPAVGRVGGAGAVCAGARSIPSKELRLLYSVRFMLRHICCTHARVAVVKKSRTPLLRRLCLSEPLPYLYRSLFANLWWTVNRPPAIGWHLPR